MTRDFTYVDDIVESLVRIINKKHYLMKILIQIIQIPNQVGLHTDFNIGNSKPVKLLDYIEAIEKEQDKS